MAAAARAPGTTAALAALAVVGALATACADPTPPGGACDDVAARPAALSAADRKLVGAASPYPADGELRAAATTSCAARWRRAARWRGRRWRGR
ncbi:MAG: hypothetical protein H6709_00185 [Kofleriaceae bacterium]|nr:hypothetical protein [Kofleriaceae bacterium]